MVFDKIYEIPFEKKSNKDIIAGNYDVDVKKILIDHDGFEKTFLKQYDSYY